jgi:hypothetical protein
MTVIVLSAGRYRRLIFLKAAVRLAFACFVNFPRLENPVDFEGFHALSQWLLLSIGDIIFFIKVN